MSRRLSLEKPISPNGENDDSGEKMHVGSLATGDRLHAPVLQMAQQFRLNVSLYLRIGYGFIPVEGKPFSQMAQQFAGTRTYGHARTQSGHIADGLL